MKKDVIYIDIEDDITAIIGKVKAAEAKIVALVPPKRVGVLQSAVNLKLLQRAAASADKRAVLITNDHSLVALAAGLKMPVAKNLQSAPEIPQIPALEVNDEEIINGAELPVGELADSRAPKSTLSAPSARKEDSIEEITPEETPVAAAPTAATAAKAKADNKFKIPNFDSFRKKIFLFGGVGAALLLFLIWATVIAPKATVTIAAKTTAVNIDRLLTLDPKLDKSDPKKLDLKPSVETLKKSVAVEFTATGSKEVGDKATGEITVTNCEFTQGFTLAKGSTFTGSDSGLKYKSTESANLPGYTQQSQCSVATTTVPVEAVTFGPDYNQDAQAYTISGGSGNVTAEGSEMDGGSKKKVTVISQQDVNTAQTKLEKQDEEEAKNDLLKEFGEEDVVIQESFMTNSGSPVVTPNVGEEASQAKLTVETTYTLIGLPRDDLKGVLQNVIDDALKGKDDQQLYSLGDDNIVFQGFQKASGGKYEAQLIATGYIGPKIDTAQLAKDLAGKRFGEIESKVNQIPGVNNVGVEFSPFWVTTAPGPDKIDIRFSVDNETGN